MNRSRTNLILTPEILEMQRKVIYSHLNNDSMMFERSDHISVGTAGVVPLTIGASCLLGGYADRDRYPFLPYIGFDVTAHYAINLPEESFHGGSIFSESRRIGLNLKVDNGRRSIHVEFLPPADLFQLRNLVCEDRLLSIVDVDEQDMSSLPFDASKFQTFFSFNVSSTTYTVIDAIMDTLHPNAESVISQFLEIVNRRFEDYRELEQYFRMTDDSGNRLWEEENMQSRKYNSRRRRLHRVLFREVVRLFRRERVRYRTDSILLNLIGW